MSKGLWTIARLALPNVCSPCKLDNSVIRSQLVVLYENTIYLVITIISLLLQMIRILLCCTVGFIYISPFFLGKCRWFFYPQQNGLGSCLNRRILTLDNLTRRGQVLGCKNSEESAHHMLIHYGVTWELWTSIFSLLGVG